MGNKNFCTKRWQIKILVRKRWQTPALGPGPEMHIPMGHHSAWNAPEEKVIPPWWQQFLKGVQTLTNLNAVGSAFAKLLLQCFYFLI